MNLKILFLRSNPIDPDPRVEKEARALVAAGYKVIVLGWDRTASLPLQETHDGFIIYRLGIKAAFGKGLANLPALIRWQIAMLVWLIHNRNEYAAIHACDFDTVLPAWLMKLLYKKIIVYDIFDFYADHLRATPGWIKFIIRHIDYWIISKVDALILCDESRRTQIQRAKPLRLFVIYNSPEELDETQINNFPTDASEKFHISYVGLLQRERGLFEMIEVLSRHPEWQLDLAGFGGDEPLILERVKDLPNISWHGRIPYYHALMLSAKADVLFATYDPTIENHRYSSPNKIFEAMMLGKPVIVARNTNMDRIVEEAHCGIVVEYGDVNGLEKALLALSVNPELRNELGRNGRLAYQQKFSWTIMKNRLISLYNIILR